MLKESKTLRPADLKAEEPVWEGKWTLLFFLKNGYTTVSPYSVDTEELAIKYAKYCREYIENSPNKFRFANGKIFTKDQYSHAIPIPWKEKD